MMAFGKKKQPADAGDELFEMKSKRFNTKELAKGMRFKDFKV